MHYILKNRHIVVENISTGTVSDRDQSIFIIYLFFFICFGGVGEGYIFHRRIPTSSVRTFGRVSIYMKN